MTIITDEIVEKAASAAYADMCEALLRVTLLIPRAPREWDELREEERGHWRSRARAALEAVLPDVVEMAAKKAEDYGPGNPGANHTSAGIRIATAIRSLLNKEGNANG